MAESEIKKVAKARSRAAIDKRARARTDPKSETGKKKSPAAEPATPSSNQAKGENPSKSSTDKSAGTLKQSQVQKAQSTRNQSAINQVAAARLGVFKDFSPDVTTDQTLREMTILPDPDVVLSKLGKSRADLEVIEYDADVYQALDTRRDVLISSPLRLEPANSEEAAFIAEYLFPYTTSIIESAFPARLYGMSVTQCRYEITPDGYLVLAGARQEPLKFFNINANFDLTYNDPITGTTQKVDTDYRCIWTRCAPTVENPYGRAMLSVLYWPWFFKNNMWRFLGQYLERCAVPLLVGKGSDPQQVLKQLMNLVQDAVCALSRDDEVDMIEAARISASDIFMDPMHEITRIFQTVILGQTLTSGTDGGTGNRALGEVHEKVRQDKATSDKRLVLPALQRPVDIMMAVNFPNSPVQVKVLFEENVGLAMDRMTRDKGLVDSGIVLGFDRSYIASSYGIGINSFVSGLELLDMNEDGVLEPGGEVAKIDETESGEDTGDDDTNTAAGATTGTEHETGN